MAYNKNVQRVLGGGLDYRTRAAELPDHYCQKMTNCAFDENRSIRSRKGHTLVCNASGAVRQIINALDARWAATSAAVDKDCTALIACSEAHIVGFKGFVWAMGSDQRKSDGENDWRWIPKAPTEAPTIETAEEVVTLIDDFTGGWVVENAVDDDEDEVVDEEDYDENGLFVQGADDTVKSFSKWYGQTSEEAEEGDPEEPEILNLYDGYDIDDLFRIRLRAKKWSNITGVSFEVDVNDGSFKKDYYKVRLPLKELLAGKKETITFYFRKRLLAPDDAAENKNRWGAFERIGQTTEKDWRSVVRLRVKVEFRLATRFWFSRWEMVGNEDNTLEGDDFGVYYTYTTEAEHESNPSPKSKLITVNHGSINVTDLVMSDDPQVTGMNIYLTGGTLGAVYRVNGAKFDPETGEPIETEPITTEEYTITASANDLTDLNIQLEEDHDDPPEGDGIAGPYYGRILAWKGSRLYWTHQNKPFAFANPDGPDGAWVDLDENAGDIKAITCRPYEAWIYCENEVFVLNGDPADANGEIHATGLRMGTPSRNGVAQAGPADIAYLTSGIYLVDSSGTARKLSTNLEPIFQRRVILLWDGTAVIPISDPANVCVGYEDGVARFSYTEGSFNYAIGMDRWVGDSRKFSCYAAEGESGILGGQTSGTILHLEDGFTDESAAIPIDFLSKPYDCGIHDNEKRAEDLTTYYTTGGATLTETLYYQEAAGVSTTLTGLSDARTRNVFQLASLNGIANGIRARNFAVGITGNVDSEAVIEAIDINYYPEAREAKSYDTAVTDAGTSKVKLIRELQIDLENETAVTVTLQTDVPAFALATANQQAIGANTFRRTEPLVMPFEVYAHDFRVTTVGSGYFHMFGVRALVQTIGHYLHGSKGEYYLSDPIDWASERVKMAREIEVVYRMVTTLTTPVGSAELTLETDIPSVLGVSEAIPFTLTASRQERTAKLRLTGLVLGRLFRVRISPTVDFRLEALRIRMKAIGEPSATPWTWVDFPLTPTTDAIWVDMKGEGFGADAVG